MLIKDNEPKVTKCLCVIKKHVIKNINHANLPAIYKTVSVDSFDIDLYELQMDKAKAAQAKKIAVTFVKEFDQFLLNNMGLFFHSKTKGAGKTRLAISILIALITVKEIQGLYCSEYEILDSIKASFSSNTPTKKVISQYSQVPFLIIDDFGMEKQTEWVQQTYTKIIDERLMNNRLSIFTSNLTFKEIEGIYKDGRLPSRLQAMAIFVPMPEEDIRVKTAHKLKEEIKKGIFNESIDE